MVTISFTKFPNFWGDVDVVLIAKTDKEVLSNYAIDGRSSLWKQSSIFDCYFFSLTTFLFAFLGLRGLNKQFSKE